MSASEVGIVDVSVDAQLGPDVRANLLMNITRPGGPPAPAPQKRKKGEKDTEGVLAKRKHQITYLAAMVRFSDFIHEACLQCISP